MFLRVFLPRQIKFNKSFFNQFSIPSNTLTEKVLRADESMEMRVRKSRLANGLRSLSQRMFF